jgi:hypothetical protein
MGLGGLKIPEVRNTSQLMKTKLMTASNNEIIGALVSLPAFRGGSSEIRRTYLYIANVPAVPYTIYTKTKFNQSANE